MMRFCAENDWLRIERMSKGELRVMNPAGGGTGASNLKIIVQLGVWAEEDRRGIAFDSNTGFTLPDGAMLSPDGAWIERSRWNSLTEDERARFAPICPGFVVELRSESDRLPPLIAKMQQWIENGASVTIYGRDDGPEQFVNPGSVQGDGPIRGFELVMSRIWQ